MQTRYKDLVSQTFEFPQDEFKLKEDELLFHDIDLMGLIQQFGTPFKFTYLPQIGNNIERAKNWFEKAMKRHDYQADYNYCYCTKSSHFSFIIEEALKNGTHIETSSSFDLDIVQNLIDKKVINKDHYILCNGFKDEGYLNKITSVLSQRFDNTIVILDSDQELKKLQARNNDKKIKIGIRIATEEEPKFPIYTSRLGIGYQSIVQFYENEIKNNPAVELKMLHFFINSGITDTSYYWNELIKCLKVYTALKADSESLEHLDIGGGFPIKNSLGFQFDYEYVVNEIISKIKMTCKEDGVEVPNIFTEFGSFTVGESGGAIYQILEQKLQNDREKWNMINSSFITTLPDAWAINQRFVMLPVNKWNENYERVLLGGLTCDSDDYYDSEQHTNAIYLPVFDPKKPLYIGFFNTGAYQESIGGYGGIHHCLIPQPKHLIIDGDHKVKVFSEEQSADQMLSILGY